MMNILALSLVFTSILTAGFFSPTVPDSSNTQNRVTERDDVIVKEGHRVVVVEYENQNKGDHGNTKVLISPQETRVSCENSEDGSVSSSGAKELICDAFGKCKEKISSVVGRSKDKVVETSQKASDKIHNVNDEISDSVDSMTNKAEQATHKASDKVYHVTKDAKNKAEQTAHKASDRVYDVTKDAKDKVKETVTDSVNKAEQGAHKVSDKVYDDAKNAKGTVTEKAKEAAGKIPGMASYAANDTVATSAEKPKEEEGWRRIFQRVFDYVAGMVGAALAVVHLLGFSVAYGTCFWVTFASSYVLSRYVPSQQYGMVQSKLYGVYFRAMASSVGAALVAHLLSQRGMTQSLNLLVSLFTVLVNLLYLEPLATKVMFERMKLEKEEGRGGGIDGLNIAEPSSRSVARSQPERAPVRVSDTGEEAEAKVRSATLCDRLKKLNTYSSFLNLATLMSLSWHLVYLAQTLSRAV